MISSRDNLCQRKSPYVYWRVFEYIHTGKYLEELRIRGIKFLQETKLP